MNQAFMFPIENRWLYRIIQVCDYCHLFSFPVLVSLLVIKEFIMSKAGRLVFVCFLCAAIILAVVWLVKWIG